MKKLLYSLHSGNLYGTERMALATAVGLRDEFETIFIAPPGLVHAEAERQGFRTLLFQNPRRYLADIRPFFAEREPMVAIGTRVLHTMAAELWSRFYGVETANINVVHGGADERLSYGRKRWLNRLGVKQVAVSNYVKERMTAHGADSRSITVIENFLTPENVERAQRRPPFCGQPLSKVVVVSRLDPIKRVDLLLDAIGLFPDLRAFDFEIYGDGSDAELLKARAHASHPNVHFMGFCPNVAERISQADLLLHLCPEEPFGLVILEGMAAGLVSLVPDSGGAGSIVEDGKNGFHFHANDPADLGRKLLSLRQAATVDQLRSIVAQGFLSLRNRFSASSGVAEYRKLIHLCLT
jgi:glycosyltransferase involved in cell wall biosynthesis